MALSHCTRIGGQRPGSVVQILLGIGIGLMVSRSGVAGCRAVWDPGRICVLFGWMRLSSCCCLVFFSSFTELDLIASFTSMVFCLILFVSISLLLFPFLSGLSILNLLFSNLPYFIISNPLISMSVVVLSDCISLPSAIGCLNGVYPLLHMGQSLIVQY